MKQTAMQEMNEWLNDRWSDPSKLISCIEVYDKIQELLPKEKQQIVDAANWGIDEAYDRINGGIGMAWHVSKTPEQYYNKTYNP